MAIKGHRYSGMGVDATHISTCNATMQASPRPASGVGDPGRGDKSIALPHLRVPVRDRNQAADRAGGQELRPPWTRVGGLICASRIMWLVVRQMNNQ
jgi:hypothetical protein